MSIMFGIKNEAGAKRTKPASELCKDIEQRISDANMAITETTERLDRADSPDALLQLRSQLDFSTKHRGDLIEQRVALEEDRLEEVFERATEALATENPLAALQARHKQLHVELHKLELEMNRSQKVFNRLHRDRFDAQTALAVFRNRPKGPRSHRTTRTPLHDGYDERQRDDCVAKLRARLEAL